MDPESSHWAPILSTKIYHNKRSLADMRNAYSDKSLDEAKRQIRQFGQIKLGMLPAFGRQPGWVQYWSESMYLLDKRIYF